MKNIVNDKFMMEYYVTVFVTGTNAANYFVNLNWREIEADECRAFEKKFDHLNDVLQCYLVQYARDDIEVIDCNLIAEYCMDGKLVGEEIIDNLPAVNNVAQRVAGALLKHVKSENDILHNRIDAFKPVFQLKESDQKQIIEFAKRKLEG